MKTYLAFLFVLCSMPLLGQGDIGHIKNQPYLKLNIDCNCKADSCVTSIQGRYCANLSFQRMDSLLTVSYDSLLCLMRKFANNDSTADTLSQSFIQLQEQWRKYRHNHSKQFWNDPTCNANYCGILYLKSMKYLTELRYLDLQRLIVYYNKQIAALRESEVPVNIE